MRFALPVVAIALVILPVRNKLLSSAANRSTSRLERKVLTVAGATVDRVVDRETGESARKASAGTVVFSWKGLPQYAARLIRAAIDRLGEPCTVVGSPPSMPIEGMERVLGQRVHWINADAPTSWRELGLEVPAIYVQSGWSYPAFSALGREVKARGGRVIGLSDANWRGDMRQRVLGPVAFRVLHRAHFDAMVVPGRQGERLMRYFGVPASCIRHGMYGADPTIFSDGPPLATRPKCFLFVGQLIARKGVLALCRAFLRFSETRPGWTLRICGSGAQRDQIPDDPRIVLDDFVQPEQLAMRFHAARFFVLPSLIEAWGLVVHEAALCGCALILSDAIGSADDLTTVGNAVRFRAGSEDDIVRALQDAADRDAAWLSAAEAESRALAAQFGPEHFATEVVGLIRQLRQDARADRNQFVVSSDGINEKGVALGKFICAFRGRRDDYQVPLALAEANLLGRLVTDIYCPSEQKGLFRWMPSALKSSLKQRYKEGLPSALVKSTPLEFILERILRLSPVPTIHILELFDALLSRRVARMAARSRSHLFVYSPHADHALRRRYDHPIKKVLFQFHPHWRTESELLRKDQEEYQTKGLVFSNENWAAVHRQMRIRTDDAWRRANLIICASSFTRRTLLSEGAASEKIVVVPYGVSIGQASSIPSDGGIEGASERCRALFVGSGIQRKGLHHLLLAWERAILPKDATLTVVCRIIDPCLQELISRTKQVVFKKGVEHHELSELYRNSSFFCMPSLIEGFGQVYLEALGHGLPILGTANTGVPDLGNEKDGVFCAPVGDIDLLARSIERLARLTSGNQSLRYAARSCAMRFTWEAFRQGVIDAVAALG